MAIFLHQRPADGLIQLLNRLLRLLSNMSQDAVYHLALVEPLLTLDDIFGRDTTLGKIDITYSLIPSQQTSPTSTLTLREKITPSRKWGKYTFLFVDPQHNNDFVPPNTDELLDGSDTSSRQLREQDHAVDVIVLKELDVGTHLGDLDPIREPTSIPTRGVVGKTHLLHVNHDIAIHLGILFRVVAAICERHDCRCCEIVSKLLILIFPISVE